MKPGQNSQLSVFHSQQKRPAPSSNLAPVYYPEEFSWSEERETETGGIWQFWKRRGILIVGVAAAVTTAVFSWTLTQKNEYEGKFQLLVELPSPTQILANPEPLKPQTEGPGQIDAQPLDFDSQLEVLQSPQVMQPILKQLQAKYPEIDYSYLFSKKTGDASLFNQDRLSIQRLNNTKIIEVKYRDDDPKKIQQVLETVAQGYLSYGMKGENSETRKTLDFIQSQIPTLSKRADSIQVEVQKLRQQYNFIDPQIQTQQIAQQVNQLQTERLATQTQINQQQLLYTNLQAQLGLNEQQALMASALTQAPRYQALLGQLQELEAKIAINSATFTELSPQLQTLQDQRKNLIPLLRQEAEQVLGTDLAKVNPRVLAFQDSVRLKLIEQLLDTANQIQVLAVRERVLEEAAKQLNQYSQAFPVAVRRYTDLQRDWEITNGTLNNLLAKQQTLQLEAIGEKQVSWQMIAKPAIPTRTTGELIPVSPNLPLNLALGGVAGVLLGLLVAQIAEHFTNNKVFHTPAEVKHTLRLPLLGVIPTSEKILRLRPVEETPTETGLSQLPMDAFQEAFRTLNANIRLLSVNSPIRSCAITSCQVADGKSTIAVNLALAAAAMGQRVLLVDADLRRPQVHEMLSLPNWQGLSSVIAQDVEVEKAILPSRRDENLFVLPSGPIFPDPTKLLASLKMQHLMTQLASQFDLVIYDTPPLLGLADANLLAARTEGLMLVVGLNQTEREALILALEDLKMAGVPLLGMVANGDKGGRYYYQSYTQQPHQQTA